MATALNLPAATVSAASRRRRQSQRGMTLIELLVVLVILAVIAAFAVPRVMNYLGGAKRDAAAIQVERLSGILELYQLDTGRLPTSNEGLSALVAQPAGIRRWNGPYVKKSGSLNDPWGNPYGYRAPGQRGAFDIYSLGADGRQGGDGENADVGNW